MTKVVFTKQRGAFRSVSVTGHAGYADEGEDIVCAAITSAMQLTHVLLDDVLLLDIDTEVDQEATFIRIVLPDGLTADEAREAQHALRALRVHYGELEKEYAQFIHVTEVQHDA
ncbi:ribosomal-processing cysteine protease Prp [Intestinibacillus massiliensis]|uniref:ribosomal-processing cysteine protease Prp n=1 Tax=Intestinibacillus massiliensis TaxID=1871029 RepID=UPI000B34AB2B|nr:ribosomal-processing cysteine protease Prp [Intestinibacillus massiliensis]MCB6365062.1 ribosomal-processing cysteine protease Prp [Intestinibacillus massiliensis]